MPDHILETRLWLPGPRPEVFAFFAEPANLTAVTPRWLGLTLLTVPPELEAGAVIDCQVRWLGVPLRWRSMIREYDPPYRFVDVQLWGPYARWEHRHLFLEGTAAGEGETAIGTWVEDRVTYQLPFGALGRCLHALLVRRQLEAIFAYRRVRLLERFEARR
ncbi:MAG: SRPBCC family protein [Candidatus Rokubacteria bacterium]|nr:SRPBCC family protein [Candidatus Rokubacteria bacterium]